MRHATRTGKKRTIPRRWRSTHSFSGVSMIIHSSSILSSVLAHTRRLRWGRGHVFYDPNRSNFGAPVNLGVSIYPATLVVTPSRIQDSANHNPIL